jgi:tetratricopeptide (TPR) repeat protein
VAGSGTLLDLRQKRYDATVDIKRPRSHVLEDQTRRRFYDLLPPGWVPRSQKPDYGLDEQVQIFRNEVATEYMFGVQLKGTDQPDRSANGIKHVFETRHLLHYARLPFPVMLVVLDAGADLVFFGWNHRIVWHLDRATSAQWRQQQTITVELTRVLGTAEHAEIDREVTSFYDRPRIESDKEVAIDISWGDVPSDLQTKVRAKLRGWESAQPGRLRFLAPTYDATVSVSTGEVTLQCEGWEAGMPLPPAESDAQWESQAFPTIQLAVCFLVFHAGRPQASVDLLVDLLARIEPLPPTVQVGLLLPLVPMMFATARRTGDALSVAEMLLGRGELSCAAALGGATILDPHATSIDRDRREKLFAGLIAVAAPGAGRASIHYTLANTLRNAHSPRKALTHYRRAAVDDPTYRTRAYWWYEIAGCLFAMCRFRLSENFYRRAVELSGVGAEHARALLADALFRQGRLGDARRELDIYMSSQAERPLSDAVLHHWAAKVLADSYGEVPQRNSGEMSAFVEKALSSPDLIARRDLLRDAVHADPMSALAWFNLGVSENFGVPAWSWKEFLLSAVLEPPDLAAWANAILIQLQNGFEEPVVAAATLATAYRIGGANLDEEILRIATASGVSEEAVLKLLATVRQGAKAMSAMFASTNTRTLRILHPHPSTEIGREQLLGAPGTDEKAE